MPTIADRRLARAVALAGLLLPALVAAQGPSQAAAPGPAAAAATAFVPERLDQLDRWIGGLISGRKIPGAVVLLMKDGEVAYEKAWGVRDVGTGAPLRPDDVFRIASMTKAVTSLAALMLWEEGRFQLDDPIERWLPAFANPTVLEKFEPRDSSFTTRPARRKPTVRQLFTHTSGLDYADIGSPEFRAIYAKAGLTALGAEGATLAADVDRLGRLPLRHEPGERFTYSIGVDVLGRLVEIWSGMPLDRFLRTRIFEPLGMRDTGFELAPAQRARLVALHAPDSAGRLVAQHAPIGRTHPDWPTRRVTYFSGGGGLSGTTRDYARFLQLVLNGGELDGVRLLGRKTVEMMLTNQVGTLEPPYGLGFALETPQTDWRTPLSPGTFYWSGAFKTYYWADPKERLVALLFTNVYADVDFGAAFRTFVYSALR